MFKSLEHGIRLLCKIENDENVSKGGCKVKQKILGYEDIQVIREFDEEPERKIALYDSGKNERCRFGVLFENPYEGKCFTRERSGAYVYETLDEAIGQFSKRINYFLIYTLGSKKNEFLRPPGSCGECSIESCLRAWNMEYGCYAK